MSEGEEEDILTIKTTIESKEHHSKFTSEHIVSGTDKEFSGFLHEHVLVLAKIMKGLDENEIPVFKRVRDEDEK